jgi:TolA-binding protein
MMKKKAFLMLIILIFLNVSANSQVFEMPNAEMKSHEELTITLIQINADFTIIHLKNQNMLERDAWACVDPRTVIQTSDKIQHSLIRAENIPLCPATHQFDSIGEILEFALYFPAIDPGKGRIDLVEVCDQSCFFFQGIILDNRLNHDIYAYDEAYELYLKKEFKAAMKIFSEIVEDIPNNPTHIYGFSYYYLVLISNEMEDNNGADEWFEKLKISGLPDANTIIRRIEELGIFNLPKGGRGSNSPALGAKTSFI